MRLLLASASLAALAFSGTMRAQSSGQCTTGTLGQFAPPGPPTGYGPMGVFVSGYATSLDLFSYQGTAKLLMRENYGYTIYDLSNPAAPGAPLYCDIEAAAGYAKAGDGFNTVFSVGAAADGSRILVGYLEPHGNLLMGRGVANPPGCTFNFAGEFPPSRGAGEMIVPQAGRYLGLALAPSGTAGLYAADVSTFLGGTLAQSTSSLAYEYSTSAPVTVRDHSMVAGHFVVYNSTTSVVIVDFGSVAATGSIVNALHIYVYGPTDFGLPVGDQIGNVAAAIHPDGLLYVAAEAINPLTHASDGYGLVRSSTGATLSIAGGVYLPVSPWVGGGAMTALATPDDVLFFAWNKSTTTPVNWKLLTLSANAWGTDRTPNASYDSSIYTAFSGAFITKALAPTATQAYVYVGTSQGAFALPVSCPRPPLAFYTVSPCRLFDTRDAAGVDAAAPSLASGEVRTLPLQGRCGIPTTARMLSVNVTSAAPATDGYFTVYRGDLTATPITSSLNFLAGEVRANNAVLEVSQDGNDTIRVFNGSTGAADVVVDVNGYFE